MKQTAAEAFAPLLQRLNALRAVEAGLAKPDDPARSCPQCGVALEIIRGRNSSNRKTVTTQVVKREGAPDSFLWTETPLGDEYLVVHKPTAEPCPLRFETLAKGFSEDEAWGKLNVELSEPPTKNL